MSTENINSPTNSIASTAPSITSLSNFKSPNNPEPETIKRSNKDLTKAERRAIQEKQRAEKEARKNQAGGASNKSNLPKGSKGSNPPTTNKSTKVETNSTPVMGKTSKNKNINQGLSLFKHLETSSHKGSSVSIKDVHPIIIELASQFKDYRICGSNARCIAMLQAFKTVINDYITPSHTPLCRHLVAHLTPQITYLVTSRPLSISMGNAIRYLKREISEVDPDLPEEQAKALLNERIDQFIVDRITAADVIIANNALEKITDGDVIMTYGGSSVIQQVLEKAHSSNIRFRVIVVDAGPRFEGKYMLRKLVKYGVECTYTQLTAVAYIAKEATKVFLGAHGLFSNGTLLSRAGNAIVAMTGYDQKIPVIVCCETYKFSEKVQLDSIVWNEIGDPKDLLVTPSFDSSLVTSKPPNPETKALEDTFESTPNLFGLNLLYDLTPPHYISMVITEVGMIPCTSVPVVLREYGTSMQ